MLSFATVKLIFVVFSRKQKPNEFCSRLEPITLTQATLVFPLVFLSLLYIPTFLYLARISWNKFGKHADIVQNCVLLVFAVTTNFSLFKMQKNDGIGVSQSSKDKKNKKQLLRTKSLIHFTGDLPYACKKRSFSCMQLSFETSKNGDQMINFRRGPQFSPYQSNILYLLYFLGAFIILFADIAFYIIRNNSTFLIWLFKPVWVSKVFSCLLIFNFLLWLDFNRSIGKKK